MPSEFARTLLIDSRGLWIGYFKTTLGSPGGLGQYNKKDWASCNLPEGVARQNVNAITADKKGNIWLATESNGVAMFDGSAWHHYTRENTSYKLPSDTTFGITVDDQDTVWVSTWDGIATFDGKIWNAPYTGVAGGMLDNPVHAVAFDSSQNIWVGHVRDGISELSTATNRWIHYTVSPGGPGGKQIRAIIVRKAAAQSAESVWFATADGGVSKYEQGKWTVYNTSNGLPSNEAHALAIDKYNRVWVGTAAGVVYFDGAKWIAYDTWNTSSIAFGPKDCPTCPFDDDHVWTGTSSMGLTHARVPYPDTALDVVTVSYPKDVVPGQIFTATITVNPRAPYQLREDHGDFLVNVDASDDLLFGAFEHITVNGIVQSGAPYTFTMYPDHPFVAPQLPPGVQKQTFTSTWRVWMFGRFAGPPIPITFTVHR
jgi:hypothetical protein